LDRFWRFQSDLPHGSAGLPVFFETSAPHQFHCERRTVHHQRQARGRRQPADGAPGNPR